MKRQRFPFGLVLTWFALVTVCIPSSAIAADELEQARATFREALVLEVAGDWAAALAKFQEVGRTRLTPQVRYHLARCKENLGRLTEALGDYRVAEAEARATGLSETPEIERARRDLEARVPTLLLHGGPGAVNLRIELDGISIGNALLNRPMVLNPGQHQITLRNAAGTTRSLIVTAQEGRLLEIDLQRYDDSLEIRKEEAVTSAPPSPNGAPPGWAYWAIGGGAASLIASAVLFAVRKDAKDELDRSCVGNVCEERLRGVQTRGEVASILAPITLGLGIAATGTGIWGLLRRAPSSSSSRVHQGRSTLSAGVWPGGCGVTLGTTF